MTRPAPPAMGRIGALPAGATWLELHLSAPHSIRQGHSRYNRDATVPRTAASPAGGGASQVRPDFAGSVGYHRCYRDHG
ncbi:hypothetical protein FRACA_1660009 [Frankia canadensis]|uniref:Uncharacterized protein n=1 Tax=Frankia canadensis TaxID=1836972 RepID=A0A2I2KMU7_9ACTN|nr:hypothetical protein FRACA_1660009 [Frankia canadensis]SOU54285.1 hypothetical protein FRACA_1660009 [Frankia canadensis]